MLNQMKQQGQQQMQQQFDGLAQRSMQQSGVKPDAENPAHTIGTMVAGSIIATLTSAKENGKSVPPEVVLQSAMNLTQQLVTQYGLSEQQLDQAMGSIFMVAMQLVLEMGQGLLSENEMKAYQMFLQKLMQDMQGQGQSASEPQQQRM